VAGEGEEHLVQAGLAEGELADGDAGAGKLGDRGHRALAARPSRGACGDRGGQRRRVGPGLDGHAEEPGENRPGVCSLRRVGQPDPQDSAAGRGLELAGRAFGDDRAVIDDRDPAGELVGLVQVLVVSSTVAPAAASERTIWCTWARLAGSRPVVGSSRKYTSAATMRLAARSSRRRIPPE
jgi:hypothetical protein